MELFKLLGTVAVDNAEALKQLKAVQAGAKAMADSLEESNEAPQKTGSKWGSALKKVGSGAVAVGKTIATGLGVGAAALGGLTVKALSAAGELEQNMGGSEAVFKEHAGKMQETAKTAFSDMGLSTSDFLATANKMGALFQGAGFDIETSATMSSDAMQRAADVASIMGIDTASAMEAIAGAAKGNFTMMDNLGVAMNDTTLQAYALSKGIDKSTQDMTNQEKIGLAMEMFMEKTAYAAGNYAKENETLAGSLGTAKAALSNFLSGAGTVEDVVSSFSNAANVIVKNINTMFPALMSGITQLVEQIVPLIPPLLEQLLPGLIEGATGLINGIVAAMPQIVSALMAALPALIEGITQIVNALITALPDIMQALVSALPTLLPALIDGIVSMIVTLCTNFAQIIQPIIDYLPAIIISIVNALLSNLPAIIQGIIQLVLGIVNALPQIIQSLVDALPQIVAMIVTALLENLPALIQGFIQLVAGIVQALPQIWASLKAALPNIFKGILNGIKNVFSGLGDWFKGVFDKLKNIFTNAWNAIKNGVSTALNAIKNIITTVWNAIKNAVSKAINAIKNVVVSVWNAIKNAVSTAINAIKNVVTSIWNGIKSVTTSVWNGIKSAVSNVVNGVKNTISNVFNGIKSTVTNIWNGIKTAITTPIQKARDTIKGIVDKIKGFFTGMKLSFPKIKMPHFKISPSGWKIGDLLKGSIPKLGIEWYAKAMDNPMVMTKPTIFGYNAETGKLQGGGEVPGGEMIGGTNTVMKMISAAVASQNSGIVYYLKKIIEMLSQFFPDMLEALDISLSVDGEELATALASPMNNALGKIALQKGRGR